MRLGFEHEYRIFSPHATERWTQFARFLCQGAIACFAIGREFAHAPA